MSPKTASSMRGIAALALLCAVAAPPAMGQQPTESPKKQHTVRKGDTLWDIAKFYLSDPFRWPMIYEANRSVVENPHWIYPKEQLVIVIPEVPADATRKAVVVAAATAAEHTRFYTPTRVDGPTMITADAEAIPLVQPMEWLAAPWIGDRAKLDVKARVMQAADPRVKSDKLDPFFHPRDKLFLKTVGKGLKRGDKLLALRVERDLDKHGWIIVPQGILLVDSLGPNSASATIVEQFAELQLGDLAIPLPTVPALPANRMTEVTGGPAGQVLDFLVDQPLWATADYAFVNVGSAKGVDLGDEFLAYVPPQKGEDGSAKLNEQAVARMRVVRVTEGTATVRVTRLTTAALARGLPARVVRVAN